MNERVEFSVNKIIFFRLLTNKSNIFFRFGTLLCRQVPVLVALSNQGNICFDINTNVSSVVYIKQYLLCVSHFEVVLHRMKRFCRENGYIIAIYKLCFLGNIGLTIN